MAELHHVVSTDPLDPSRQAAMDSMVKAPVSIGAGSHLLHEGEAFTTATVKLAMLTGAKVVLAFKTPTDRAVHFGFEFGSSAGVDVRFREGTVWTPATGSTRPVINRNRLNAKASALLEDSSGAFLASGSILEDPAITVVGTQLHFEYVFGDRKTPAAGKGLEFVLNYNRTYTVEMTATTGPVDGYLSLTWAEHTSG